MKEPRRGSFVAGYVGIVGLVLMIGVLGLSWWSAYSRSRNPNAQASEQETVDSDLGLQINVFRSSQPDKVDITARWTRLANPPSGSILLITIGSKSSASEKQTVVDVMADSKDFTSFDLQGNDHYAQIKYVPPQGSILRQTVTFSSADFVSR